MKSTILVIAAHPDDEILGCAGTVARMVREGYEAYTLILGEGVTARDASRDVEKTKEAIDGLKRQADQAGKIVGVKETFIYNFSDNRFDTVPLLDIVKVIEDIKVKINPNIIFTHYHNDLNIDHQKTYEAVITASRPIQGESVKEIYSFEVLSSTEWNFPLSFSPDVFFDISSTIDIKIEAMKQYETELRTDPHPRSLAGIKLNAKTWGMRVGLESAEAFKLVRNIR